MTAPAPETAHDEAHREYFKEVLQTIRKIMSEKYGLKDVSIRPIGSDASRLSIPTKIVGSNDQGERVRYFGKILGSSDLVTARSIQLFKNVYLHMNAKDPIFGVQMSAEEMARDQYEMLKRIYDAGIPTAMPYGYHPIFGILWLVVTEFLEVWDLTDTFDPRYATFQWQVASGQTLSAALKLTTHTNDGIPSATMLHLDNLFVRLTAIKR